VRASCAPRSACGSRRANACLRSGSAAFGHCSAINAASQPLSDGDTSDLSRASRTKSVEKPSQCLGSPYFPFSLHRLRRCRLLELRHGDVVLPGVALVACGHEVRLVMGAAERERFHVVDNRGEMVEEGRTVSAPSWVVVRERPDVATIPRKLVEDSQRRGEHHGAVAPSAQPTVAAEHADLKSVRQGLSGDASGSQHANSSPARLTIVRRLGEGQRPPPAGRRRCRRGQRQRFPAMTTRRHLRPIRIAPPLPVQRVGDPRVVGSPVAGAPRRETRSYGREKQGTASARRAATGRATEGGPVGRLLRERRRLARR
jgi:hypothetical protein